MDTVEHTASTILVVQMMTMNLKKGLFIFHTGALVVYKPHGFLWVQFCFSLNFFLFFFVSFIFYFFVRWVGFASALLPYGHRVVLVFEEEWHGITIRQDPHTGPFAWSWILRLSDQPRSGGEISKIVFILWRVECRATPNPGGN